MGRPAARDYLEWLLIHHIVELLCDCSRTRGTLEILARPRPLEVHARQGLKVGLYTPTILGGNSYLSWFYDRRAIKDPAHKGTSKGLSQAINRGPIRNFLAKYANVYVTIQSHALSKDAPTHYVTANEVRNRLGPPCLQPLRPPPLAVSLSMGSLVRLEQFQCPMLNMKTGHAACYSNISYDMLSLTSNFMTPIDFMKHFKHVTIVLFCLNKNCHVPISGK